MTAAKATDVAGVADDHSSDDGSHAVNDVLRVLEMVGLTEVFRIT